MHFESTVILVSMHLVTAKTFTCLKTFTRRKLESREEMDLLSHGIMMGGRCPHLVA